MTKSLYRVTDAAPAHVHGLRLAADDLVHAYPEAVRYEVDLGYLELTTVEAEARPLVGLTDAERAALPRLGALGDGPAEYATGLAEPREGSGVAMVAVPMEPDGEGGFVGHLTEAGPEPSPGA